MKGNQKYSTLRICNQKFLLVVVTDSKIYCDVFNIQLTTRLSPPKKIRSICTICT